MTTPRLGRGGAAVVAALTVAGCSMAGPDVPPPPAPVEVEAPTPAETTADWSTDWTLPEIPDAGPVDPILGSRVARHPELQEETGQWIERFAVRESEWFAAYLGRMSRYAPMVDSILAEREAPASLRYLPIVESGYSPWAVSHVSAAGMWQFMAPVARSFGMQVDRIVDERLDPVRATPAAIEYLVALEERFGSWFLALAAYNGGPTRVSRLIREHAPLSPLSDSLFLVIRPHLPRETREFIPKFLAAATLAQSPDRFGIVADPPAPVLAFDEVTVPDATTLDVVAFAAGVTEEEVRDLNPQLVRGVTPKGRETSLRIPPGLASIFEDAYARIPPEERVTVTEHVVRSGETMWEIARRYGVRPGELEEANPRVRPERLQIGQILLVPLIPRGS